MMFGRFIACDGSAVLIWGAGSQGCRTIIDQRNIIAAASSGWAVACYEVGFPGFVLLVSEHGL